MPLRPPSSPLIRALVSILFLGLILGLLPATAVTGCSGQASLPDSCRNHPTTCAADQTCWPTDRIGGFGCLPAKAYKMRGDDCEILVGETTCGPGLTCIVTPGGDAGFFVNRCSPYCDPKSPTACKAGEVCQDLQLLPGEPRTTVSACVPLLGDAGDVTILPDFSMLPDLAMPPPPANDMTAPPPLRDMTAPPAPADMSTADGM